MFLYLLILLSAKSPSLGLFALCLSSYRVQPVAAFFWYPLIFATDMAVVFFWLFFCSAKQLAIHSSLRFFVVGGVFTVT